MNLTGLVSGGIYERKDIEKIEIAHQDDSTSAVKCFFFCLSTKDFVKMVLKIFTPILLMADSH